MYFAFAFTLSAMKKKQILELFNMKLSKTIDQTRICKKNYDDPLGYLCMGLFFLLVPNESDEQISLVQPTLPLVPDKRYCRGLHLAKQFQRRRFLEIDQSKTRIACGSHVC